MTVFFILTFVAGTFCSCKNILNISDRETIYISLPQWPPEDCCKDFYPELSCWEIVIRGEDFSRSFFTTSGFSLSVPKNSLVAITAQPITKNSLGEENEFFKPAGLIYPFNYRDFSWAGGFTASLIQNLFKYKNYDKNSNLTSAQINSFISSFNWNKLHNIVFSKSENSLISYNPWLLNRGRLVERLTKGEFSSNYLNISSQVTSTKSSQSIILSSYIPENEFIYSSNKIPLKKGEKLLFYTGPDSGIFITYLSSKKVSVETVKLPIKIRSYEKEYSK